MNQNAPNIQHSAYTNIATTSTTKNSFQLPTIFDILSEESLKMSLKAGIKQLTQLFLLFDSNKTKFIKKYFDEFYAVLMLFLENHYIKYYLKKKRSYLIKQKDFLAASFSENFYGMKRVSLNTKQNINFNVLRNRLNSLIYLVILPYIGSKIDIAYNYLNNSLSNQKTILTKFFLFIYPYLRMSYKGLCLIFKVFYTLKYLNKNLTQLPSSPLLYFSNVFLALLTPEDIKNFEIQPLNLQKSGIIAKLWRFSFSFLSVLGRIFSYGIFLFQFLEYFYANDFTKQLNLLIENDETPPFAPPHPLKAITSENHVFKSIGYKKCPLCYQTRKNDTVLSISGYIFCYDCIYNYLNQTGRCPITLIPANINQLIKIYEI